MKDSDREDAMMRALDLLPEGDPRRSDPRWVRDEALAEEARTMREAAVDVWLTVSPLRAAPVEILDGVMRQIPRGEVSREVAVARRSKVWWFGMAGGWAAAAMMALWWWVADEKVEGRLVDGSEETAKPVEIGFLRRPPREVLRPVVGKVDEGERLRRLSAEIERLKSALAKEGGLERVPMVKGLMAPGSPVKSMAESRQELQKILIDALRSSLEVETGAPGDAAVMVIERGWPLVGLGELKEGETVRHRNFPESQWQDLGLLRSEDGSYYDPASRLIWSIDPEGRGFVGRTVKDGEDLGGFRRGEAGEGGKANPFVQAEPSGYLIENPDEGSIDVIIEGMEPAEEGQTQWLVWTLPDGSRQEQLVDAGMFMPSGTLIGNMSAGGSLGGVGGEVQLHVQIRAADGTVLDTVLQSGR